MPTSYQSLMVTSDHAVPVEPLGGSTVAQVVSGDTLYYADNSQVSSSNNQGTITAGNSQTFTTNQWIRSASLSSVTVTTTADSLDAHYASARDQVRLTALGMKGQTWDLFGLYNGTNGVLTSQAIYTALTGLLVGDVVQNVYVNLATPGVGTVPTGIFLGLYTTGGTLLASTANLAASANWTGAAQTVGFPLSSSFTVTASGGYYFAFLQNGAFATTPMKLALSNQGAPTLQHSPSGVLPAALMLSQATLPASATFASTATSVPWFGWS